ncbi:MAG: hypothetical protein Q8N09_10435, partial [Thermodesulfovibrionia bacterium]|nr:hypothetical protein [Thermodesulfovibrionia bacterium]
STLLFPSFPQSLSGNPVFSLVFLDSCWSLSRVSYGAGMTTYEALLMNSLVTNILSCKSTTRRGDYRS